MSRVCEETDRVRTTDWVRTMSATGNVVYPWPLSCCQELTQMSGKACLECVRKQIESGRLTGSGLCQLQVHVVYPWPLSCCQELTQMSGRHV